MKFSTTLSFALLAIIACLFVTFSDCAHHGYPLTHARGSPKNSKGLNQCNVPSKKSKYQTRMNRIHIKKEQKKIKAEAETAAIRNREANPAVQDIRRMNGALGYPM